MYMVIRIKIRREMLMEGKMNVTVDKLIENSQDQLSSYRLIIDVYSSVSAVLEINRTTIKTNIRKQLIKLTTEVRYIQ